MAMKLIRARWEIAKDVEALARRVSHYPPDVVMPIMNAALLFSADLLRALYRLQPAVNPLIYPIATRRDGPELITILATTADMNSSHRVLVVDTICDSGRTIQKVVEQLNYFKFKEIDFCCLVAREGCQLPPTLKHFYYGFMLETKDFLYGYGLDRDGRDRGMTSIYGQEAK